MQLIKNPSPVLPFSQTTSHYHHMTVEVCVYTCVCTEHRAEACLDIDHTKISFSQWQDPKAHRIDVEFTLFDV